MNQANVGVGLGEVANLPVGGCIEHLRDETHVVGVLGYNLVEVIEPAVSLAGCR